MHPPSRVAFSTLAFPDATLASAVSLGRRWGYAGVELRLLAQVKDTRRGRAGDWQLVLLGEGEVPVRQMLGLLAAARTARGRRLPELDLGRVGEALAS
jgi:hypothetical protein